MKKIVFLADGIFFTVFFTVFHDMFKPKYDLWRTQLSLGPNTVTYISFNLCVGATNQMKIVEFKV